MTTAVRKKTIREQMHQEDIEQAAVSRTGRAERHREDRARRWNSTIAEHEAWLAHLDAAAAEVQAELAAVEGILAAQKQRAEASSQQLDSRGQPRRVRSADTSEVLELNGEKLSAARWQIRRFELQDSLKDFEEGFTPIRSSVTIDRLSARGIRPRIGCMTVFQDRFGARTTRRLIDEAKASLAELTR